MDWTFSGKIFDSPLTHVGFVYIIVNNCTGRKYIGKKSFWLKKTRMVKGKKKRILVESDWKEYYGSNEELNKDVLELGRENFSREILYLCKTKTECTYFEAKEQFIRGVLESEEYYNSWIMCRIRKANLKANNEKVKK